MPPKERHDFKDLLQRAQAAIQSGEVSTFQELAYFLAIKPSTLQSGFHRHFGISNSDSLFEKKPQGDGKETKEIEYGEDFINIVCASRRIRTMEDAIEEFKVDLNLWKVDRCRIKTSEGYRKDRKVSWHVSNGVVIDGNVEDTGKLLIAPMYHVQLSLTRKTEEIRARLVIEDFLRDARRSAPKYSKIKYPKKKNGLWYEIDMPDIHFGKETWAEESGEDYNIEIARRVVTHSLDRLIHYASHFNVEQIVLPMGNDFFNVDNKNNTTTHGTPQQEDTRWAKTFREGKRLAVEMIDRCAMVAPVKVVMVAGNHDEERSFYLGEVLDAQYFRSKNVTVDISAKKRKYLHFGNVLIGYTHGYHEKLAKLPSIMPLEEPTMWAGSVHREWHLGDKHHKKDMLHRTEDVDGVTIRLLRSLSATDTWHFDKGYVGTPRSAEAFLWDKSDGLVAQFQSVLREQKTP